MYAYIDAEKWAEDGQPAITEHHGFLVGTGEYDYSSYGFIIVDQDQVVAMSVARGKVLMSQDQPKLPKV